MPAMGWFQENGAPRDMVCRGMMLVLHRAGYIRLPEKRVNPPNPLAKRKKPPVVKVDTTRLDEQLRRIRPLEFKQVRRGESEPLFNSLLEQYHYLCYCQPVGEHLKYMVFSGGRPIACLAFSSAPFHIGCRDRFIGWPAETRKKNLHLIAYNNRFLILLHIDATGEHGQGTLLVVMAGWRKWVLGSWKIATERAELILPCLHDTVRRFGSPCAVMRDMGRAVSPAVNDLISELQLDIPVLACHQHFLSDIGTDLLKSDHSALRELFRQTKIRPKTNKLVRELGRKIGFEIDNARQAVLAWQAGSHTEHRLPSGQDGLAVVRALAQWVLDYKADLLGLDFPFDRPYLAFYNRCTIASRAADAFLRTPLDDPSVSNAIVRFSTILSNVIFETQFHQIVTRLQRRSDLFDELRDNLRLAKTLPEKESEGDLQVMCNQFEAWAIDLEKRRPKRGPAQDIRDAIDIILKHIDKHGCNLWGHSISLSEKVIGEFKALFLDFPEWSDWQNYVRNAHKSNAALILSH